MNTRRKDVWLEYTACLVIGFLGWGVLQSFGTFLPHIIDKYGETRAKSSIVHAVFMGVALITGVFTSVLIRRVGTGITSFIGAVCLAGGFIVSFFATELIMLYVTIGVVAGIGSSFTFVCAVVSTGRLFEDRRQTLFLSIQNGATGFAGIVFPYFFDWLILVYGINGAFLVLGGIFLNAAACALLFYFSHQRHRKYANAVETTDQKVGKNVVEIPMKNPISIVFILCLTIVTSNLAGLFTVFVDILTSKDVSNSGRLASLVVFNVFSTLSRFIPILLSFCTDNPLYTLLISTLVGLIGSITLLLSTALPLIMFGSAAMGITDGATITAASVIVFKMIVPESQTLTYGLILTSIGVITTGIGPLYGSIYDMTESYFNVLLVSSSVYAVAVVCAGACTLAYNQLANRNRLTPSDSKINENFEISVTDTS